MVKITTRQLALRLENPFKLSYGTSTVRENVLVQIDDGVFTGVGEAAVVPYYHETPERIRICSKTRWIACRPPNLRRRAQRSIWRCMTCGRSISANRSTGCGG
jgi:L-alanine-DL-glutamate epimerase-like enolase superfamily enzyme